MTEDEMVGWHHQLDGHEFEQAPGVHGQGSLEIELALLKSTAEGALFSGLQTSNAHTARPGGAESCWLSSFPVLTTHTGSARAERDQQYCLMETSPTWKNRSSGKEGPHHPGHSLCTRVCA